MLLAQTLYGFSGHVPSNRIRSAQASRGFVSRSLAWPCTGLRRTSGSVGRLGAKQEPIVRLSTLGPVRSWVDPTVSPT